MVFDLKLRLRTIRRHLKMTDLPWGIVCLRKLSDTCCQRLRFNRETCYRVSVVFLTYIAYMSYHMSRKPISVVKAVLHRNCSDIKPDPDPDNPNWCDWAPFDGNDSQQLLGELDSSFLFCYAVAMFASGFIAERVNLRYFLAFGMVFSGIFSYGFGIGKTYDIHNIYYYVVMQGAAGIAQTTGWPGVVTVMSNWFGKSKRGLIFGLWNSHTSIGNILGTYIAGEFVETDWAYSFIVPGAVIALVGLILFLFLVVNPGDVGLLRETANLSDYRPSQRPLVDQVANDEHSSGNSDVDDTPIFVGEHVEPRIRTNLARDYLIEVERRETEGTPLLASSRRNERAIGFVGACKIPGVIEFSLSLFFSKLVSYTFLYWLPLFINSTNEKMSARLSADISILFDVGGIAGAILAGVVSDKTGMSATTCVGMLILAAPLMIIYQMLSAVSLPINMFLLIIVGVFVNGPYALITTAVSADLGNHRCLEGNSKAMATVTAIIDGTGSIGAAVGPLLAGFISSYSWKYVFIMLMISDILALVLLLRLVKQELSRVQWFRHRGLRRD